MAEDTGVCTRPVKGWTCTRQRGHEGPCAAVAQGDDAALTLIRQMLDALKDADHLCKWLLQSDISEADRERVIRENGVSFAVQIAAAEKFLEGR